MTFRSCCSAAVLLASAVLAQSTAIVATEQTAASSTLLLEVDLASGAWTPLPGFADAIHPPLAVAWDAIDDRVVVVVDRGSASRIVRIGRDPAAPFERVLADVPGRVSEIAIVARGDLVVATEGAAGGIWRVERNGSAPQAVAAIPHVSAMWSPPYSEFLLVVEDPPGAGATLHAIDLGGVPSWGPFTIPTPAGATVTGVADLPTGAPREVLCDDRGGVWLFEFFSQLTPLAVSPPVAGGFVAMRQAGYSIDNVLLGDAADPYLSSVVSFGAGAGTRTVLAGPLPDRPVDFAITRPLGPDLLRFGATCGVTSGSSGSPRIGRSFGLDVRSATPGTTAFAAFGISEQVSVAGLLPFDVPGGCPLYVSAEIGISATVGASGSASISIGIPNQPSIVGTTMFAQWVVGASLATSDAVAIHVGP